LHAHVRRCGHMSEETKSADRSAPWGIVLAIGTSAVVGWGYILALLFSIQVRKLFFSCLQSRWIYEIINIKYTLPCLLALRHSALSSLSERSSDCAKSSSTF